MKDRPFDGFFLALPPEGSGVLAKSRLAR
jgi:hypothetical protein